MPPSEQPKSHSFQAPKGTRDFYPADLLRKRYIEKAWRDTSIRHGFEEIDGPTFEHLELYTVKSGEGIVSELFSFRREGGEKDYALRPEFTPTLARMYAAKAGGLPKPAKWFWQQNCYRAERPQRGRLREFGQWNCDVIGDNSPQADSEIIACCVGMLETAGLTPRDVRVRFNHRAVLGTLIAGLGIDEEHAASAFVLLDRRDKMENDELEAMAFEFGIHNRDFIQFLKRPRGARGLEQAMEELPVDSTTQAKALMEPLRAVEVALGAAGIGEWCDLDLNIARGLAYYTGMVFEVHEAGGKERAIAGGGRYDKLIEMFGGPSTPAVGFGMGDVVLSLVLEDRGLLPEGQRLLEKLDEPATSLRPDVFVISNGQPESDIAVRPLVAKLRRGEPGVRPLHARHTYKATKNIGKLLQDASGCHARFAAIIESASEVTLKDLDKGVQEKAPMAEVGARVCH
jgi:histidyl-tRNA synthetase